MSRLEKVIRILRWFDRRKKSKQLTMNNERKKMTSIRTKVQTGGNNNIFWTEALMTKKVGEKVTYILNFKGSGIKAVNVEISYPSAVINFSKSANNPLIFDLVPVSLINGVEGSLQVSAARTDAGIVSPINGDWICRLEFNCIAKSDGLILMKFTKKTMIDKDNQAIANVSSIDNNQVEVIEEVTYGVWLTVE